MFLRLSLIGLISIFSLFLTNQILLAQNSIGIDMKYDAVGKIFVENCEATKGTLVFIFDNQQVERRFEVKFTGDATPGTDFQVDGLSDTLVVGSGIQTIELPFTVNVDNVAEGREDLTITLVSIPEGQEIASYSTSIYDEFSVSINDGVQVESCKGQKLLLTASEAGTFLWTPSENFTDATKQTVEYVSNESSTVHLTAGLGSCTANATINVSIINTDVLLTADKDTICGPSLVTYTATAATQGGVFTWSPAELFPNQNSATQSVLIKANTQVKVSYTKGDCTSSDSVSLVIRPGTEYIAPFKDTLICYGDKLSLGDFSKAKLYEFIPPDDIDFSDFNHPFIIAKKDTRHTVKITSTDQKCQFEHEFIIKVNEGRFELKTPDYEELCKGDSTRIAWSFTPKNSKVTWTPNDGSITTLNDSSMTVKPLKTTIYTGTFTVGPCTYTKKVEVRVDSLPDLPLDHQPVRPYYCRGEIVSLFSPQYDKTLYPDMKFDWGNALGAIEPIDKQNLAISTQDTFLYIRKTTNHACVRFDSLQIDVKIPKIQFSLLDTLVCENEPVKVNVETDMTDLEWKPEEGVTCSNDCKTAIIKTANTTTYTLTGKADGCPGAASMTIRVKKPLIGLTVTDTTICPNEPVTVSVTTDATNISWSPGEKTSCNNCATTTLTTPTEQNFVVGGIQDGCPAWGGCIIRIRPPYQLEISVSPPDNVAIGNPVTASVVNPIPGASYQWKINGRDLGVHGSSYEIVLESKNDRIEALLVPGGNNYCFGSGEIFVAGVTPYIYVPNSFTPNGDSKNDVFRAVVPDGVTVLEMTIVNRWGQRVFTETNTNNGWDGRFNGKEAPSDTYVFIVKYQLLQGGVIDSRRGEVTLYR